MSDRELAKQEIRAFMADPRTEGKKQSAKKNKKQRREEPAQVFGAKRRAPSEERFDNKEYQEKMDEKLLKMLQN